MSILEQYVLCTKRIYALKFLRALEILNNPNKSLKIFKKFYQFIKKIRQFIFELDIPDTSCFCQICENATTMA